MNFEYTGWFAIVFGIFIFLKRETFVLMLLEQQRQAKRIKGINKLKNNASESYLNKAVILSSIFCITVGILVFLGILHGPK